MRLERYTSKKILGGLFIEKREIRKTVWPDGIGPQISYGPAGYRLNEKVFSLFLERFERDLKKLKKISIKFAGCIPEAQRMQLQATGVKHYNLVEKRYRPILNELVLINRQSGYPTDPFFDLRCFSRKTKHQKYLWKFVDLVYLYNGMFRGKASGAPSGSRSMTIEQKKKYNRVKKKGLPDAKIAQKIFPKEYASDEGDPIPKHKMRLSRLRQSLKRPSV